MMGRGMHQGFAAWALLGLLGCSARVVDDGAALSPFDEGAIDRDYVGSGPVCLSYCSMVLRACPGVDETRCLIACAPVYGRSPRATACFEPATAYFQCSLRGERACGLLGRPTAGPEGCDDARAALDACLATGAP